ncbi:MAG: ABC transporter ATP-binding protein [Sphaerochaetaceae bacterium]
MSKTNKNKKEKKEKKIINFKAFKGSIDGYKKDSILTSSFVIIEVLMEVLIPLYMAQLIDFGFSAGSMSVIWKIGLYLVLMSLVALVSGILNGIFAARASSGVAKNIRKKMYNNIQEFSFENLDSFSTSSLITRLTTDITSIQNSYQMLIRMAVRAPLTLIFSFLMAYRLNAELSLVFIYVIPLMILIIFILVKFAMPLFRLMYKTFDKLNKVVQENLRGIRVVKAYVREDFETDKFKSASSEVQKVSWKAGKIMAFASPLIEILIYGCVLAISWIGAKLVISSNLTTGSLATMITYTMQILISFLMLTMTFVMIVMARPSMERVSEVLSCDSKIKNKNKAIKEITSGDIEFKDVSFKYKEDSDNYSLKHVNLKIPSGATVGILGETGSSKTTLVQLIPRLYEATDGEVLVGGHNVKDYDLTVLRDSVSMVLQKNVLFSGTLNENLRWGNSKATQEEIIHCCALAQADDFIQEMEKGYETFIQQDGMNVSGGQKQRICIARALLKNPKILILDDSTSAVDTATEARLRESFKNDIANVTKLIISQRISSVKDADMIIVLSDGKIDGVGSHEELIVSNKIYQEINKSQIRNGEDDKGKR